MSLSWARLIECLPHQTVPLRVLLAWGLDLPLGPPRIHVSWPKFLSNPLRMLHASRIITCYVWQRTGSSYCCPERLPLRTPDLISEAKDQRRRLDSSIFVLPVEEDRIYQLLWRAALNGQVLFVTAHFRLNQQPSLQSAWTECIIPHIETDTDRISQAVCSSSQNSIPSTEFFSGMLTSLRWEKPKDNRKFTVSSHGEREMNSLRYKSMSQYTVKIRQTHF